MDSQEVRWRQVRFFAVAKLRGVDHIGGWHTFRITPQGIHIYPRVESLTAHMETHVVNAAPPPPPDEPLRAGIEGLEEMLGGGPDRKTTTLVVGTPGSGKTISGLAFLQRGDGRRARALHRLPRDARGRRAKGGGRWVPPGPGGGGRYAPHLLEGSHGAAGGPGDPGAHRRAQDPAGGHRRAGGPAPRRHPARARAVRHHRTRQPPARAGRHHHHDARPAAGGGGELRHADARALGRHGQRGAPALRGAEGGDEAPDRSPQMRARMHDHSLREFIITDKGLSVGKAFSRANTALLGVAHHG